MDELKLSLSTKFMTGILAKLITKTLVKKLGYKIDIRVNQLKIETKDGKIHVHADVDGAMDNDEFIKILKSAGLD